MGVSICSHICMFTKYLCANSNRVEVDEHKDDLRFAFGERGPHDPHGLACRDYKLIRLVKCFVILLSKIIEQRYIMPAALLPDPVYTRKFDSFACFEIPLAFYCESDPVIKSTKSQINEGLFISCIVPCGLSHTCKAHAQG